MTTLTIMKEMSMGYKAKCKYCGKSIDTNSAYKIVVGKTNRYYCNEEEYNIIHKAQQIKDDTYNLIYEIFGRKITNTILYKEINELSDIYSFEKIEAINGFESVVVKDFYKFFHYKELIYSVWQPPKLIS